MRVLGVAPGREVRVGVVGGGMGIAEVVRVEGDAVELAVEGCREAPPEPLADLTLALPRPKALRRLLRLVATLGVGRLDLVNAWRVERSFFSSAVLEAEAIRRELLLGAEQGVTSRLPEVRLHRFLMPYLEALEAELVAAPVRPLLLAHPGAGATLAEIHGSGAGRRPLLAIGPEGGWVEKELASFRALGFRPVALGPWVLTTEAAVAVALGQIALLAGAPAWADAAAAESSS